MVNWEFERDRKNPELLDMKSATAIIEAKQFERLVKWPLGWKYKAQLLLKASEHIFDIYDAAYKRDLERFLDESSSDILEGEELEDFLNSQLLSTSLLLKGFAIENLIKGIIYSQDPNRLIEDDKGLYLDGKIKHHRLDELYLLAGLAKNKNAIDPETNEILEILEEVILWQGRYPIPLNLEQYKQKKQIPDSLRDPKKINDLCIRLYSILNKIPTPRTH